MLTRQQPQDLRQGQDITPQDRDQGQDIIPKTKTLTNMTKTRQDQDTAIPSKTKVRLAPRYRQKLFHIYSVNRAIFRQNNISIQSSTF